MKTLVTDWCQQFTTHSVGDLQFGPDGALYASGGDGASFDWADSGQDGNPCADPTDEGGALRSQDLRTTGDPTGLDGSIIRIDPDTGAGAGGNPFAASADPNARRIVAYGLRNPFRFTFKPGTSELYTGDVGWNTWEEINTLHVPPAAGKHVNFGWPCYEGASHQPAYEAAGLGVCDGLYADGPGAVSAPFFTYDHGQPLDQCGPGGSAVSGVAFARPGDFPAEYQGGLFFADYARGCIWFMAPSGGLPDPAAVTTFAKFDPGENAPVDLQIGPDGGLYDADIANGTIWAIRHGAAPTAVATADVTESPSVPPSLTVHFDATGSTSPNPGPLTYAWDLDGNGVFDDSTEAQPTYTYYVKANFAVRVKVTDATGASSVSDVILITPGNTKPHIDSMTPSADVPWSVGDTVHFSATASDAEDGSLSAAQMSWQLVIHHCPSNCHVHYMTTKFGIDHGTFTAPDHEYPSYLSLTLTVTDSGGQTAKQTIDLHPSTVLLCVLSDPGGRSATINGSVGSTPLKATVIRGSNNSVGVTTPQHDAANDYGFAHWSDGGARTHQVVASVDTTLTASFDATPIAAPPPPGGLTPPLTATPPATPTGPTAPSTAKLRLRTINARIPVRAGANGRVPVRVRCVLAGGCDVRVTLEGASRLGTLHTRLKRGATRSLAVPLTLAARRLLARRGSLRVRSIVTLRAASGSGERITTRFTLRAPRP